MAYGPLTYGLHPKICQNTEPNDRVAFPGCGSNMVLLTLSEGGDGNVSNALGLALSWEMGP